GPLGTVRPLLRPSWLTALPRITARIRSPSRWASDRRLSTTRPQPSPRTKPSADASKVLHRPSGDSIRALHSAIIDAGVTIALTPPARAASQRPARRASHVWLTATSDELQAVSIATHGPCKPST